MGNFVDVHDVGTDLRVDPDRVHNVNEDALLDVLEGRSPYEADYSVHEPDAGTYNDAACHRVCRALVPIVPCPRLPFGGAVPCAAPDAAKAGPVAVPFLAGVFGGRS